MTKRQSNRPDRRVAPIDSMSFASLMGTAERIHYVGSGHHKLRPGDYGLVPPNNPRPSKSACDDLGPVRRGEAVELFRAGLLAGMVSTFAEGGCPKYIWAVGDDRRVFEAKIGFGATYHGYRLGDDERDMRRYILDEWRKRCPLP